MNLVNRARRIVGTIARDARVALRESTRGDRGSTDPQTSRTRPTSARSSRPGSGTRTDGVGTESGARSEATSDTRSEATSGAASGATSGTSAHQDGLPRTIRGYDVAGAGLPRLAYAPSDDGDADPGEVVWAWVPYEENNGQGKDRPVLVIARHDGGLLGLQLTSKDHDRDAEQERRWGRIWMDVGSGGWDSRGRESEVRLDRVLFLPPDAVRREGAALPEAIFRDVSDALRDLDGR